MINSILFYFLLFTSIGFGQNWEVFTPENSALETDVISEILVDNNNVVWIATGSGLAKFENDELTLLNNSNSILPTQNVTDLFIDNNNLLWVLFGDKIYRGINSGFELFRNDTGGSEIAVDSKNNVYLANGFDIFRLSNNVDLDTIYYPSRTNPRHISSMVLDEKGNLWFTKSANFGEYWIYSSGNILESDSLDNGYETTGFICFKLDNSGNIWLMGTHGKLMKFDIEKEYWYDMNEKYSLDFEVGIRINTLDFDKNNNLYFTTTRSFQSPVKLYSYNGNEFEISTIDSLYPEDTFSKILSYMAFDNDNNLYLAADEVGLFKLNASTTSVTTSTLDKIKIYPNPAKNELNFDLGSELVKSITITDLTGKKIITYNSELNNLNSIDISALITGQYFISFEITDQSVINKKFVKE